MNVLSLEQAKRDPNLRASWSDKLVYIYSREYGAYWRREGAGYVLTKRVGEVGVFDFSDAFERTQHCGPEKGIEFEEVRA